MSITISPSYVGEPECNEVMERFLRTLKEQCLSLHQFTSLEEARPISADFLFGYNTEWLIERLRYRPPAEGRGGTPRAEAA
jgi:putative transposase